MGHKLMGAQPHGGLNSWGLIGGQYHNSNSLSFGISFASFISQAKLRYDPIELDPEDMCRMASEQPQVRILSMHI